jgi:hypothetical protein
MRFTARPFGWSAVLRAVAADFFCNCWCVEIPSDNRIRQMEVKLLTRPSCTPGMFLVVKISHKKDRNCIQFDIRVNPGANEDLLLRKWLIIFVSAQSENRQLTNANTALGKTG